MALPRMLPDQFSIPIARWHESRQAAHEPCEVVQVGRKSRQCRDHDYAPGQHDACRCTAGRPAPTRPHRWTGAVISWRRGCRRHNLGFRASFDSSLIIAALTGCRSMLLRSEGHPLYHQCCAHSFQTSPSRKNTLQLQTPSTARPSWLCSTARSTRR